MATEAIQQDQDDTQTQNERQARGASQPEQHETARPSRGEERRGTEIAPRRRSEMESAEGAGRRAARADRGRRLEGYVFDPRAATRVALLNMAHSWMEAGSTYSAIYAYEELLRRYPDGGAAAAATEGIVEIVQTLQQQGKYYTALHVLETLDELL